jgi:MtrB/PioB family decaheme-associated outer membrane protein
MIMKTNQQIFGFSKSLLALAILAVYAPAYADDAEIAELSQPSSSISVGASTVSGSQKNRTLFGQYNGLRENDANLQVDLDINKRDEVTVTGLYIKGNNLGLDDRDLSVSYEKQGDWKLGANYSELVHHELRTINSSMAGLGSATPLVKPVLQGAGLDYDLKLKRVGLGLSGEKWINQNLQFELAFKTENKTGARTSGLGYQCAAYVCSGNLAFAQLLVPEPVDTTTQQIEAKLNYHDKQWNVTAGYYGSFFSNANGNLTTTIQGNQLYTAGVTPRVLTTLASAVSSSVIAGGGTSLKNVLQSPFSLAPDNQAHQFYVSGNYRFAPTTVGTFKYAYTHATQNDNFLSDGLSGAPAGVTSLNGVVDTTLIQFGLTARPMPKLSLLANLKYEDKKDSTPDALYNVEGGANPAAPPSNINRSWNNYLASQTKLVGKLEASYQLPADLRGTFGLDYSSYDRPVPVSITDEEVAGLGAVRAKNQEAGYRLELRRSISETLNGSIGYSNSKRTGGDWTSLTNTAAFIAAGLGYGQTGSASQFIALSAGNAFPMNMVDVNREKVKMSASWMPTEKIDVQFNVEDGKDKNANVYNPVAEQKGWLESNNRQFSVDASFVLSDKWKLNGYVSQGTQHQLINHSTGYKADLETRSDGVGFGVVGVVSSKLEVGAQLTYFNDSTRYGIKAANSLTGAAASAANLAQAALGLPDVTYKSTTLNLYGKYALQKNADIRVNLIHQRAQLREWSWVNNGTSFVYQDGTTVGMNPDQSVTFLGASYVYKF